MAPLTMANHTGYNSSSMMTFFQWKNAEVMKTITRTAKFANIRSAKISELIPAYPIIKLPVQRALSQWIILVSFSWFSIIFN